MQSPPKTIEEIFKKNVQKIAGYDMVLCLA